MNARSFPLAGSFPVPGAHWDGGLAADIFAPAGTAVLAVFDGAATARWYDAPGNTITLDADDGTQAYYAHLAAPGRSGRVAAGDVLGEVGTTGHERWGDPHLHFAVGRIDWGSGDGSIRPADWLAGLGAGRPLGVPAAAPPPANLPGALQGAWDQLSQHPLLIGLAVVGAIYWALD